MNITFAIRRLQTWALLGSITPLLAGCLAFFPVTDYAVRAEAGRVSISNCLGKQYWMQDVAGVRISANVGNSSAAELPATLYWTISPKLGQSVRIPLPELRVRTIGGEDATIKKVEEWRRIELRTVGSRRLERVVEEQLPGIGPVVGGTIENGLIVSNKHFSAAVRLDGLPDDGYVVEFPSLDIDGKPYVFPPVEFKRRVRVEFMVPINC